MTDAHCSSAANRVRALTPDTGLGDAVDEIAHLRIRVFRDWPYLYDGDLTYERTYLKGFARSPGAVCIAAYDGARMIGAATGLPMAEAHDQFAQPFRDAGEDITRLFYCAESVLLPEYRGHGLYRQFFEGREAHARSLGGLTEAVFCGVIRPDDHPLRPEGATSLDPVWRHFGYAPCPERMCRFSWLDVGESMETEKPLMFWRKRL